MSERIRGSYDDALQIDVYFTLLYFHCTISNHQTDIVSNMKSAGH